MNFNKKYKAFLSATLVMSMTVAVFYSQLITKASNKDNSSNINSANQNYSSVVETSASKYISEKRDTTITTNEDGSINISRSESEDKIMGKEDSWTIFFYMCGSNLETEYECTTNDIQEMLNANFTVDNIENLNVIIQTGGSKQWHSNRITNSHIGRYKIDADSNMLTCIERMPQKSMGDPDTLYDYLNWGIENYAAEHMAVIFWNHGGGVENGVCFDENYNDDYISVHDLEYTFAKLKNNMTSKFELIGFDTCLSGSIEYANLLTPYAKYLVAAADTAPAKGWNYTPVMNHILENPDTTGDVVGKIAVEHTSNFLDKFLIDKSNDYTWAYYDLSKTDKVCIELNNLSKYLYTEATTNYNEKYYDMYSLFNKCIRYNYNNIDVGSLLYAVEHSDLFNYDTSSLRAALEEFIPYSRNKNKFDKNKELIALSYYMPIHTITLNSLNTYRNIAFSPYQLNLVEFMNVASKSKDMTQFKHTDFTKSPYFFETNFNFINYDQDKDTDKEANQKTYDLLQTNSDYVADGFVQNWYDNINIPLIIKEKSIVTKTTNPIKADTRTLQLADGQTVQAYLIGKDANCTRYSIAVMIDNTPSSIRVEKITSDDGSTKLSILGVWDSTYSPYTSTKAGRGYLPIKENSIIKPIYDIYDTVNKTYKTTIGDSFTVTDINDIIVLK